MFCIVATAPVIPFLPVLARQLGFSGTVVGIIYTILPICGMLAKPLMGAIADRFRLKKTLFIIFQVLTALALLPINHIPAVPRQSHAHFACDRGAAVFDTSSNNSAPRVDKCVVERLKVEKGEGELRCEALCPSLGDQVWPPGGQSHFTAYISADKVDVLNNILFLPVDDVVLSNGTREKACLGLSSRLSAACDLRCDSPTIVEAMEVSHVQSLADAVGLYQFWLFLWLAVSAWVAMAVVVSIGDAICFELLGDRPSQYGMQRLWGSIGWGLFSIIAGYMVDQFSGQGSPDYSSVFNLMLAMMALDVLVSCTLKCSQQRMSSSIARDIGKLLVRPRIAVFLAWCVLMGMCTAMLWQFLFWHLEDLASRTAGGSGCMPPWIKTLEGLVMGIQCLGGELPFFFLSGYILRKLGHVHCMSLVLLGVGIRFILYSVLYNPWLVLPVELMNGVTFGLFYATMASYASIVAPPGTEATVQGLVGAVFEGMGISLGSLIGGVLYDKLGGALTFRVFGVASLFACAIHFLLQWLLERRSSQDQGKQPAVIQEATAQLM